MLYCTVMTLVIYISIGVCLGSFYVPYADLPHSLSASAALKVTVLLRFQSLNLDSVGAICLLCNESQPRFRVTT